MAQDVYTLKSLKIKVSIIETFRKRGKERTKVKYLRF